MKAFLLFLIGLILGAALVAVLYLKVPFPILLTWGIGLGCLAWLIMLVTLPWNLYFQAREVLFEMQRARERGIEVRSDRENEARRVQKRMLSVSIGAHVLSGIVLALISWIYNQPLGYYFSGFYLLGTFFRPALEHHRYMKQRLASFIDEVSYPREDVVKLRYNVESLLQRAEQHQKMLEDLQRDLAALEERLRTRDNDLEHKIEAVSRKFEETVNRLTDNQEIIGGIKAFLRMIQQQG